MFSGSRAKNLDALCFESGAAKIDESVPLSPLSGTGAEAQTTSKTELMTPKTESDLGLPVSPVSELGSVASFSQSIYYDSDEEFEVCMCVTQFKFCHLRLGASIEIIRKSLCAAIAAIYGNFKQY